MPEELVPVVVVAAAAVAAGGAFLLFAGGRQRPAAPVAFRDEREERLATRLAGVLRCRPDQALPALRREVAIAPDQTDDTLVKRAAYHYRQSLPDAPCPVYRDRARG